MSSERTAVDHLEAALEKSDDPEVRKHIREALQMPAIQRNELSDL